MPANEAPPSVELLKLVTGPWVSQAIYAIAKLGLADLLKDGPRSASDLAKSVGVAPGPLFRVLRATASVGVFQETKPGYFGLTPMASCLCTDAPDSLRAVAIMFGEPWERAAWTEILHAVRSDSPSFTHVFGKSFFDYCQAHPDAAAVFDEAMTNFSHRAIDAVIPAYDFSAIHKLVDVAGGHGSLLAAILKANPRLTGVLFDLPSVIDGARKKGHLAQLASRCELVAGDFFTGVPEGADAYLLKHIIHDWSDESAIRILRNCRKAMRPGGRLLLIEMVIPPGNEPHFGKLLDLEMLVNTQGGRERSEAEYRELLTAAGFRLNRIVPTKAPTSVIEGTPV
jgi:SAM-dependent methyltransferase